MRENRLSGSMRGEARRSLALASQPARFAYSTHGQRIANLVSPEYISKHRYSLKFPYIALDTITNHVVKIRDRPSEFSVPQTLIMPPSRYEWPSSKSLPWHRVVIRLTARDVRTFNG